MHSRVVFPVLVCTAACSSTGGGSADAGSIVPLDDASVVGQSCDPVEAFRSLNPLTGNVRVVERCRDDGWCLENEPQGSTLEAAWAVHDDDVWAVGHTLSVAPAGVLLHWDGRHGDAYDIALPSLHAIWGSRSDDVWAVGDGGTVAHWDGHAWTSVASSVTSDLYAVSGSRSDDVWAVGPGAAVHWDGTRWSLVPSWTAVQSEEMGLHAIAPADAVATYAGGCRRWDGHAWNATDCGVLGGTGVWASASDDVWVVGNVDHQSAGFTGYRTHWDGKAWTTQTFERGSTGFSIFGFAANDIWIDGAEHFDGTGWSSESCLRRNVSSASAEGTLWGTYGSALVAGVSHEMTFVADVGAGRFRAGVGQGEQGPRSFWATTDGGVVVSFDGRVLAVHEPRTAIAELTPLFGSSAADIWAVGIRADRTAALWHWDGSDWTPDPSAPVAGLLAGWSFGPTSAFAIQQDWPTMQTWTWNGTSWAPGGWPFGINRDGSWTVWASGSDDVWAAFTAVGSTVFHRDGSGWKRAWSTDKSGMATRITGTRRDDVWLLAANAAWRWNGATFVHSGDFTFPETIAGSGPDDVWVANGQGRLWRFDGTRWSEGMSLERELPTLLGVPQVGVFAFPQYGGSSSVVASAALSWRDQKRAPDSYKDPGAFWE